MFGLNCHRVLCYNYSVYYIVFNYVSFSSMSAILILKFLLLFKNFYASCYLCNSFLVPQLFFIPLLNLLFDLLMVSTDSYLLWQAMILFWFPLSSPPIF